MTSADVWAFAPEAAAILGGVVMSTSAAILAMVWSIGAIRKAAT